MQLTYCEASEAAEYLSNAQEVSQNEILSGVINALTRVHHLERQASLHASKPLNTQAQPAITHTPGPWTVHLSTPPCLQIITADGDSLIANVGSPHLSLLDEDQANARLIAAAPDLLEALRAVLKLEELEMGDESLLPPEHPVAMAQAAIAKAQGGASC